MLLGEAEAQGAAAAGPPAAPPLQTPHVGAPSGSDSQSASDPLSLASESGEAHAGYQDMYAPRRQQQQEQQQPQQAQASVAAPPIAAGGSSSTGTASLPRHRPQGSLTLDSLEIGDAVDDRGLLPGDAGGAGGAGPSSRPPPLLQVRVSDPVRRVADSRIPGFTSTHFEFLVTTTAEAPRRRFEVRRRFSDFVVSARGSWGAKCVATEKSE